MTLICFVYKIAFYDKMDRKDCYDNYMYNSIKVWKVPNFEVYNITAKLGMIYMYTKKYSDLPL